MFMVGQRYQLGLSTTVQITEPITPCSYLCTLPYLRETGRCAALQRRLQGQRGWYARVLTPGEVAVGSVVVALG